MAGPRLTAPFYSTSRPPVSSSLPATPGRCNPPALRDSPWLTLAFPLLLFVLALAVSIGSAIRPVREFRFREQSRTTLLEIQRALQDYHVSEEFYPKRTPMSGAEIVEFLIETGHLESPPLNPWSGEPYRAGDLTQPDGIRYHTDELAETYALEARGRDLSGDRIEWQLDSTEHQSLE